MVPVEPGGNPLIESRRREEISGQLFDSELVEGLIAVQRPDYPIAPGPEFAITVHLIAIAVGEAGHIQPILSHAFSPAGRGQTTVHPPLISLRGRISEKVIHLLRGRWKPGEVESQSTEKDFGRRLWRWRKTCLL